MNNRKWIATNGGPIIILPVAELKNWSGAFSVKSIEAQKIILVPEDDFLNPAVTDYGKACEIEDFIGTFDFGNDKAIVLGSEPDSTCIEPFKKDVFIARWIYAENDETVEFHLQSDELKNLSDWTFNEVINVRNTDYVMFDSADIGFDLYKDEAIFFTLEIGEYRLKTCEYKPDYETFLLLHKFEKVE